MVHLPHHQHKKEIGSAFCDGEWHSVTFPVFRRLMSHYYYYFKKHILQYYLFCIWLHYWGDWSGNAFYRSCFIPESTTLKVWYGPAYINGCCRPAEGAQGIMMLVDIILTVAIKVFCILLCYCLIVSWCMHATLIQVTRLNLGKKSTSYYINWGMVLKILSVIIWLQFGKQNMYNNQEYTYCDYYWS